jgi:hypothetical protein
MCTVVPGAPATEPISMVLCGGVGVGSGGEVGGARLTLMPPSLPLTVAGAPPAFIPLRLVSCRR